MQRHVLKSLLERAEDTEYGRNHAFSAIKDYETFCLDVPVNDYESLKQDIDRMRRGEKDILWPGQVKWYAKSSGTTNDKSKFIPVSHDGLQGIHYAGGTDSVAFYLMNNPASRIFDGRALILGGSHQSNYNIHGIAPIENGIHAVGGAHFAVGWHQAEQRAVLSAHQLLRSHHIDLPRSNKFGNAMPAVVPVVAWVVLRHLAAHVERGYGDLGDCQMACHVVLASASAARKQHRSAN